MAITTQLDDVQFGFQAIRDEEGELQAMLLMFTDQQSGLRTVIPFEAAAWDNFKRQVAADGEITPIALASSLAELPRMDIPKGA